MRARPNLTGEQIVTDYMTRVAQAARLLPKGARMAFVGRTRALVEREVGPPGTRTDPAQVTAVLARLGKPEDLVTEERIRIDQAWVKSRASSKEEGEAAAAALSGPRMNRPLKARRRPSPDTQPLPGSPAQPGPDQAVTGPDGSVAGTAPPPPDAGPRRSVLRGAGPQTTGLRGTGPRSAGPGSGDSRDAGPRRLRSADSPDPGPQGSAPQGAAPQGTVTQGTSQRGAGRRGTAAPGAGPGDADRTRPIERLIGQVPWVADGTEKFTASVGRLARDNLLESVAILLLGLGGLILPFPFWPIGAVVALFSRLWDVKDKSIAVTGPLLVTLALSVIAAPFVGGSGNVIVVYFHALHVSFGYLVRVGSVITAAYLAWRVSRGPRVKVPPWKRITR
jgi:hypothetical protein